MGLSIHLDKKHEGRWVRTAAEAVFLVYLAFLVWYTYMRTTMFQIPWPENIESILRKTGFCIVLFKFLVDEKWNWKELMMAVILCIGFFGSWRTFKDRDLAFYLILMLGAKGVSFNKIAGIYLGVEVPSILITIYCSLQGIIAYLTYPLENGELSHAFGSIYRTDFSAHIFFLACCLIWVSRKKIWYAESVFILWLAWFVYHYCAARNSTICLLLLGLGSLLIQAVRDIRRLLIDKSRKAGKKILQELQETPLITRVLLFPCCFSICVLAAVMILLSRFYNPAFPWMVRLDTWLSTRLSLGRQGFDQYNVKLFGQYVQQYGAAGVVDPTRTYFYLDVSYVNMLLRLGLFVFLLVLGVFVWANLRAFKKKEYVIIFLLFVVAVHCCVEHHLVDLSYDPFLMLLFADIFPQRGEKKRSGGSRFWKNHLS